MTPLEFESLAREAIAQAGRDELGEDSRVELKADWSDPAKLAPKLAAQANAARGVPVLLLIGINDDGQIVGAPRQELADWLPQLERRFDEVAPRHIWDQRLQLDAGLVHVIAFDTTTPPYVARPADPSRAQEWLIQVRRGTRTVDAGRADLLRLVLPTVRAPQAELLSCRMQTTPTPALSIVTHIYLACHDEMAVALPSHRLHGRLTIDGVEALTATSAFCGKPETSATYTRDGVLIHHAGSFRILTTAPRARPPTGAATFQLRFESAHGTRWYADIPLEVLENPQQCAYWRAGPDRHVIPVVAT